jgi:RNA polymerase sigma factor (sigma-70 family)
MIEPDSQRRDPPSRQYVFATTHWSVVVAAARTQSPEAEQALEALCRQYWYPLYTWLRRKGHSPHEAEDMTQEFFSRRIVTKLIFKGVQPGGGKFRTWLLNSLQNLVHNEWDKRHALKRGGERTHVPLETGDAEGRYAMEPAHDATPEKIYERAWAMTVLERALLELKETYEQKGKATVFSALKCFLPGALSRRPLADVAASLGKSEEAVKMTVSRLRQEYGHILKRNIRRTVSDDSEVQAELKHLLAVLGD